jgi:hypothetical protein
MTRSTSLLAAALLLAAPEIHAEDAAASAPGSDPVQAIPGLPRLPTGPLGSPTAPPQKPAAAEAGISGTFGGSLLFEKIQEDYFGTLDLFNETTFGPVKVGLWLPLRFRVIDRDPDDDGVLRGEDWDEPSDYARILRFVELNLGGEQWRFRGRFGALEGESLGHGTIVAGYFNSLDRNHYQAGLLIDTAVKWGGVALMLDNLLRPEIFGFRLHARPTSFFTDNEWANRLIVGFTTAADAHAPVALVDAQPPPGPDIDGDENLVYSGHDAVTLVGFDLEYAVVHNKLIDLVPYLDVNFLADEQTGAGLHLGTFFNFRIPTSFGPALLTRLEYRAIGDGYAPRYIDSLYEAQRAQFDPDLLDPASNLPLTKLGWLRLSDPGTNGWLGELYFDFAGWVIVGGSYEDHDGPDNAALTLVLHLPKFPLVQVGGYYANRGFDSLDQAFSRKDALVLGYARAKVYGPLALTVVYSRSWRLDEDGRYAAQDDFSVGVGVAIGY